MTLQWPGFLLLLAFVPVLIAVYVWALRRRKKFAVRYSSLSLLRDLVPRQSWIRQHLPFALAFCTVYAGVDQLDRGTQPPGGEGDDSFRANGGGFGN